MRVGIHITIEENVLKEFDKTLGLISRSSKINELMKGEIIENGKVHPSISTGDGD